VEGTPLVFHPQQALFTMLDMGTLCFIGVCDNVKYRDYNHDAEVNVRFDGGKVGDVGPFSPRR
jgi:hypothetical protein